MKVKAVLPYFGGKRTLAPKIVSLIGKHTQYFEPFCGSAAVLFAKGQSQKETVGDLHRDLINLLWCVADPDDAPVLYERLLSAPFSEDLLNEARETLENDEWDSDDDYVFESCERNRTRAFWYFIASWQGRNGTAGTIRRDYQLAVRWTRGGGSSTVRWKNAVESMPAWHRRLLNVVILHRDAFRWIESIEDDVRSAIYVDPPYVIDGVTRTGASSPSDSGRYVHDFGSKDSRPDLFGSKPKNEHELLAESLSKYESAKIVVSYYDCDLIRRLYEGWQFHDCSMNKQLHSQNGRGTRGKEAPEVLITNFETESP